MKKFGLTLLTAFAGGALALGAYKIIENRYTNNMSFEEKQKVYFANNPMAAVTSSAGTVDFTQAAAAVTPAVVYIHTTYATPKQSERDPLNSMFGDMFGQRLRGQGKQPAPQASGSGVTISTDGYIVTNNHVVAKAEKIQVTMGDHRILEAKVIGTDPNTDLALIKVNGTNLPIVKLGNSDEVRVGEWVLAVGNPFNLYSTVTAGIVSAKGRGIGIIGQDQDQDENSSPFGPARNAPRNRVNKGIESFIQTDAAINPGNSGGALVNTKGELIGINSAIASHTGSYEGYGFAIPINLAKKVLNDIQKYGSVKRGYIGVNFSDLSTPGAAEQNHTDRTSGLYVNNVLKGSGGESAGLQEGDIITKVDGNPIYASSDLQEHVGRLQPGDKVKLTFLRGGDEKTASVTLKADAGTPNVTALSKTAQEVFDKVGVSFLPMTDTQKAKYRIKNGVRVDQVSPESMFSDYIQSGSVVTSINKIPVNTIEDVNKALNNTSRGMLALSGINPDGSTFNNVFQVE